MLLFLFWPVLLFVAGFCCVCCWFRGLRFSVSAFSLFFFFFVCVFVPWRGRLGAVAAWCRDGPPASTGRRSFYACLARVPHATYGAGWEVGRGWLLACSLCNTLRSNRVLINVLSSRVCRGQSPPMHRLSRGGLGTSTFVTSCQGPPTRQRLRLQR